MEIQNNSDDFDQTTSDFVNTLIIRINEVS